MFADNYIKDNFQNILDGKFDDKFEPDQLKMMLEMSFLYIILIQKITRLFSDMMIKE